MNLPFLSSSSVETLKRNLSENQSAYLIGEARTLVKSAQVEQSKIQVDEPPDLVLPGVDDLKDAINSRRIYQWLHRLDPVQASDARVWTYLTHDFYADYTFKRWPIEKTSDILTRIRERYFVEGQGLASLVRNGIARLWWFGYLTYDETAEGHSFELTDVLVSLQDIQVAFLERAIGRSRRILRTALRVWQQRVERGDDIKGRGRAIQMWARLIRLHGAVALLDSLAQRDLENLVRAKLAIALNEEWPDQIEEPAGIES
jgi:hypothetical protein